MNLIERLRDDNVLTFGPGWHLRKEAADEIERLTAENEKLKADAPEAEPVAWIRRDSGINHMTSSASIAARTDEGEWIPLYLYLHPPHDDTALLRQCLEAFEWCGPHAEQGLEANAIDALRTRLGEIK